MPLSSEILRGTSVRDLRFTILTASLVTFVFVLGPLRGEPGTYQLLASLTFTLILLSSILACARRRGTVTVAVALSLPAVVLVWLLHHFSHEGLVVARHWVAIALFAFTALVVLTDVMTSPRVTFDVITGGIAVYLLIGLVWTDLYATIFLNDPEAFHMSRALREFHDAAHPLRDLQIFAYFSFVTLTTLGYGDIVPVSSPARSLASLEAVIGQIYMTVLVARLVGLHISHSRVGFDDG